MGIIFDHQFYRIKELISIEEGNPGREQKLFLWSLLFVETNFIKDSENHLTCDGPEYSMHKVKMG
jgi:hypothetical protein